MSHHHETRSSSHSVLLRSPRLSLSALYATLAVLLAAVALVAVYGIVLSMLNGPIASNAQTFLYSASEDATFRVQRRYQQIWSIAVVAQTLCNTVDVFANSLDDPRLFITWLGAATMSMNLRVGYLLDSNIGVFISRYSLGDPLHFPVTNGLLVAERTSPNMTNALRYVNTTSLVLGPLALRNLSIGFLNTPYFVFFNATTPKWLPPYIGYSKVVPTIAVGSRFRVYSGLFGVEVVGQCSVFDIGSLIANFLSNLAITPSGIAMLVHKQSRVYLGGNRGGNLTLATVNGSKVSYRLRLLDEVDDDPRMILLMAASRRAGDFLFQCVAPCSVLLDGSSGDRLTRMNHLFFSSPTELVRVTEISDAHGLGLRFIVMISSLDFIGDLQRAVVEGAVLCTAVACAAAAVVSIGVHVGILRPLRRLESILVALTEDVVTGPTSSGSSRTILSGVAEDVKDGGVWGHHALNSNSTQHACDALQVRRFTGSVPTRRRSERAVAVPRARYIGTSWFRELSSLQVAAARLMDEIHAIRAFASHDVRQIDRELRRRMKAMTGSSQGVGTQGVGTHAAAADPQTPSPPGCSLGFGEHYDDHDPNDVAEGLQPVSPLQLPAVTEDTTRWHRLGLPATVLSPQSGARRGVYVVGHFDLLDGEASPAWRMAQYSPLLSVFSSVCAVHLGRVALLYGDTFHCHFNITEPCPHPAAYAARFLLHLTHEVSVPGVALYCGAATSDVRCWVTSVESRHSGMGEAAWRSLHVVGVCAPRAAYLREVAQWRCGSRRNLVQPTRTGAARTADPTPTQIPTPARDAVLRRHRDRRHGVRRRLHTDAAVPTMAALRGGLAAT